MGDGMSSPRPELTLPPLQSQNLQNHAALPSLHQWDLDPNLNWFGDTGSNPSYPNTQWNQQETVTSSEAIAYLPTILNPETTPSFSTPTTDQSSTPPSLAQHTFTLPPTRREKICPKEVITYDPQLPMNLICEKCGQRFKKKSNMTTHTNKCHTQLQTAFKLPISRARPIKHTCHICRLDLQSKTILDSHMKLQHECPYCSASCSSASDVASHIEHAHTFITATSPVYAKSSSVKRANSSEPVVWKRMNVFVLGPAGFVPHPQSPGLYMPNCVIVSGQ